MEFFGAKFQIFTLLFARVLAVFSVSPFFGGQALSFFYRIALAFLVSLVVTPVLPVSAELQSLIENRYLVLILEQVFIGFFIGLTLQVLFAAFQMAGEFFSVQMGFGISQVMDPVSQISLPLMGTINNLMALFVFFATSSHLRIINAVVFSYEKIPYFKFNILTDIGHQKGVSDFLIFMGSSMFLVALKLALPIMGTLFLVSLTLGILSKAAPQMNILMLGFPLKIYVGFIVMAWLSPLIVETILAQLDIFFQHIDNIIQQF